ncbi:MAG: hypothetical protein R2828_15430 [Saprospiraceae bacterium]
MDPLVEGYYSYSVYNYTLGNPVKFIDQFGMMPYSYNWNNGTYEDEEGNEVSWSDVNSQIQSEIQVNA